LYFDSSIPVPEPNYFDLFIIYWLVTVRNKVDNFQKSFYAREASLQLKNAPDFAVRISFLSASGVR